MSEFKGTKKPWIQNGRNGIHTPSGNCIATTHMNKNIDGDETRTYDALLIASAPELLEALKELLSFAPAKNVLGEASWDNSFIGAIEQAEAAIKKALGE